MNNYYSQKNLFFMVFISIILCFNAPVTHGETQAVREIQESEEFENSLVRNVQNDYRNGFRELLNFINSLNETLTSLNAKLATQATVLTAHNSEIEAAITALNKRLSAQDTALQAQNTKIEGGFNALNERLSTQDIALNAQRDQLSRSTNLIFKTVFHVNTWVGFDSLIRAQAKVIKTGKSFNGSTLSDIKSRAAQVGYDGRHTAIVFVNHLDEAIGDLTIYQLHNFMYNPAPNSVPGRTQEVFTFLPSSSHGGAWTSFSYQIPSFDIRVAAISYSGTYGVGLAFVPKGADMKTYYESRKGIEGSTVWEEGGWKDRNISVGYKNLYARMFADHEENYKSTLRIELIKLPL